MANWIARALQFDSRTGFQAPSNAQLAFESVLASDRSYVTSPAKLEQWVTTIGGLLDAKRRPPVPEPEPEPEPVPVPEPIAVVAPVEPKPVSEPEPESVHESEPYVALADEDERVAADHEHADAEPAEDLEDLAELDDDSLLSRLDDALASSEALLTEGD